MKNTSDYYFIEGVSDEDWIGFDSYQNTLDSAIENGARFIGLIADYGTGKSTLIHKLDLLEQKKGNKLVVIDLWNCGNEKEKNNKLDIHRIFLHQLIDKIGINEKEYYKKKIDKSYSFFDVKCKRNNSVLNYLLLFFIVVFFLSQIDIIQLSILDSHLLNLIILILIAALLYIGKPIFAFKKTDSNDRAIDENDMKDIYNELINEYYSKKNINKDDTLIICLEELDRYNNPEVVLEYLKEFYKFYKEPTGKQKVTFIISLKSSAQLEKKLKTSNEETTVKDENKSQDKSDPNTTTLENSEQVQDGVDSNQNEFKKLYEKLFDFILNMNAINIQDYDEIVWQLIKSKEEFLKSQISLPEKNNLGAWRYLFKGNNITIRDIKHRYNFAINLFLSVKDSGIEPNIEKCLFISYMEDECNELYEKLIKENLFQPILIQYVNKPERDLPNISISEKMKEVLLEGLDSQYISFDYNYYFYKFPKVKKSYDLLEMELYNAIFYDRNSENLDLSIKKLSEIQINDILSKRANLKLVPNVVFDHPRLLVVAYKNEYEAFKNTLDKRFDLTNNFQYFETFLQKIKMLSKNVYREILKLYLEIYLPKIEKLDPSTILSLRKMMAHVLGNDTRLIFQLFSERYPIITAEEIYEISDFNVIRALTDFEKIDTNWLDSFSNKLKSEKTSKKNLLDILKTLSASDKVSNEMYSKFIYNIDLKAYGFKSRELLKIYSISKEKLELDNIANFHKFIEHIDFYSLKFDSYFLEILESNKDIENVNHYAEILNKYDMIFDNGMKFLIDFSEEKIYGFKQNILQKFYDHKYYKYYVISMLYSTKEFHYESDKVKELEQVYIKVYETEEPWDYSIDYEMKKFLYKRFNTIDIEKGEAQKLEGFEDFSQTFDLINAVLKSEDNKFINKYLSKIDKIFSSDEEGIYELIGSKKEEVHLNQSVRNNLKKITNNSEYLKKIGCRKTTKKDKIII